MKVEYQNIFLLQDYNEFKSQFPLIQQYNEKQLEFQNSIKNNIKGIILNYSVCPQASFYFTIEDDWDFNEQYREKWLKNQRTQYLQFDGIKSQSQLKLIDKNILQSMGYQSKEELDLIFTNQYSNIFVPYNLNPLQIIYYEDSLLCIKRLIDIVQLQENNGTNLITTQLILLNQSFQSFKDQYKYTVKLILRQIILSSKFNYLIRFYSALYLYLIEDQLFFVQLWKYLSTKQQIKNDDKQLAQICSISIFRQQIDKQFLQDILQDIDIKSQTFLKNYAISQQNSQYIQLAQEVLPHNDIDLYIQFSDPISQQLFQIQNKEENIILNESPCVNILKQIITGNARFISEQYDTNMHYINVTCEGEILTRRCVSQLQ